MKKSHKRKQNNGGEGELTRDSEGSIESHKKKDERIEHMYRRKRGHKETKMCAVKGGKWN